MQKKLILDLSTLSIFTKTEIFKFCIPKISGGIFGFNFRITRRAFGFTNMQNSSVSRIKIQSSGRRVELPLQPHPKKLVS